MTRPEDKDADAFHEVVSGRFYCFASSQTPSSG